MSRRQQWHELLNCPIGEPLTVREARAALRSRHIKEARVTIRPIFGQEEVEIPVSKKALLDALPDSTEYGDETTDLQLADHITIELQ